MLRFRVASICFASAVICCLHLCGCKRSFFRQAADRQAYDIISEKYCEADLQQPNVSIEPDTRSRFYDPTCPTDPALPIPAPQLYNYQLPELVTEEVAPRRFASPGVSEATPEANTTQPNETLPPPASQQPQNSVSLASAEIDPSQPVNLASPLAFDDEQSEKNLQDAIALLESFGLDAIRNTPPVPVESWNSLPPACLKRMLEFQEVQREYQRTFPKVTVTESLLDPAQRVNLANILEIALINNRNYQRQKELLYVTALRLSIQRFDYDLKFFSRGNGTSLDYVHNRVSGVEVNRLGIPTRLGVTKSLYTAGDLAARFANDVVLTFNGANGYSSTVGSELLVELSQPLIQRDIQFEALTQAERDVIYAARDFVRFRKVLFSDLAARYYALLLTYRSIAINTQDFFSNLSGFNRSAAYESVGQLPRFQVDQFEQSVLRSRGSLISACNSLERALDQLKFTIGLPPEMPLNLDLSELESLTLRDEATVIRAQISRKRDYVTGQLERYGGEVAVPAAAEVVRRMRNLELVLQRIAEEESNQETERESESYALAELSKLVARLEAEDKRIEAESTKRFLAQSQSGDTQLLPGQILGRTLELVETTLEVVRAEVRLLQLSEDSAGTSTRPNESRPAAVAILKWAELVRELNGLSERLQATSSKDRIDAFPKLIAASEELLAKIDTLEESVARELGNYGIEFAESEEELKELARFIVEESGKGKFAETGGLAELRVDVDEAMLTALVQRLDLKNVRGELADQWRDIKYTGDALKGILNINASQSIRTQPGDKEPFDFSFDNSTTRLGLDFDTPLNRRLERNNFRTSLINYNVALRNLIQAQDSIKLDIRNDLREIELDRDQYDISIASAALAYERVASTRIQLALGQGNVSARDFLEAQQAYTESLSSVANRHIAYIVDRIQFFLDLEQLQVDQFLFWPDLRNEDYPFLPNLDFPGSNPRPYGRLACGPWYSECLRRMEQVPPGVSMIHPKPGETTSPLTSEEELSVPAPPAVPSPALSASPESDQMIDLVPPGKQ